MNKLAALATQAVELEPTSGIYWNTLGVAHYRAANWKGAVAALEKSMELRYGGDSFDWFFLAMAHSQLDDKALARNWYRAAVLWMSKYAARNADLRRFRDQANALVGVTAKEARPQSSRDTDVEIWKLVLEAQPESVAAYCRRGHLYSQMMLWDVGAAYFDKAFKSQVPSSPHQWFCHALLRAHVRDSEGYRQLADQLSQRCKQMAPSNELARTLTLAPAPGVDLEWAAGQAELATKRERGPWSCNALGLVHFRAGRDEQALGPLQEAVRLDRHWRYAMVSYSVLAMAHHRLGRTGEARKALTEADRKVEQWQQSLLQLSAYPAGRTWWDLLEGLVLYREAKELIAGSAPPDDARQMVARAHAFAVLGDRDRADEACNRAAELGAKNPSVHRACADIRALLDKLRR